MAKKNKEMENQQITNKEELITQLTTLEGRLKNELLEYSNKDLSKNEMRVGRVYVSYLTFIQALKNKLEGDIVDDKIRSIINIFNNNNLVTFLSNIKNRIKKENNFPVSIEHIMFSVDIKDLLTFQGMYPGDIQNYIHDLRKNNTVTIAPVRNKNMFSDTQHFSIHKDTYVLYYKDEDGKYRKVTKTEYQELKNEAILDDNYILLPEGVQITEEGKLLQDTEDTEGYILQSKTTAKGNTFKTDEITINKERVKKQAQTQQPQAPQTQQPQAQTQQPQAQAQPPQPQLPQAQTQQPQPQLPQPPQAQAQQTQAQTQAQEEENKKEENEKKSSKAEMKLQQKRQEASNGVSSLKENELYDYQIDKNGIIEINGYKYISCMDWTNVDASLNDTERKKVNLRKSLSGREELCTYNHFILLPAEIKAETLPSDELKKYIIYAGNDKKNSKMRILKTSDKFGGNTLQFDPIGYLKLKTYYQINSLQVTSKGEKYTKSSSDIKKDKKTGTSHIKIGLTDYTIYELQGSKLIKAGEVDLTGTKKYYLFPKGADLKYVKNLRNYMYSLSAGENNTIEISSDLGGEIKGVTGLLLDKTSPADRQPKVQLSEKMEQTTLSQRQKEEIPPISLNEDDEGLDSDDEEEDIQKKSEEKLDSDDEEERNNEEENDTEENREVNQQYIKLNNNILALFDNYISNMEGYQDIANFMLNCRANFNINAQIIRQEVYNSGKIPEEYITYVNQLDQLLSEINYTNEKGNKIIELNNSLSQLAQEIAKKYQNLLKIQAIEHNKWHSRFRNYVGGEENTQHFKVGEKTQDYVLYYKDEYGEYRKVTQTKYRELQDSDISGDNYILLPESVEITKENTLAKNTQGFILKSLSLADKTVFLSGMPINKTRQSRKQPQSQETRETETQENNNEVERKVITTEEEEKPRDNFNDKNSNERRREQLLQMYNDAIGVINNFINYNSNISGDNNINMAHQQILNLMNNADYIIKELYKSQSVEFSALQSVVGCVVKLSNNLYVNNDLTYTQTKIQSIMQANTQIVQIKQTVMEKISKQYLTVTPVNSGYIRKGMNYWANEENTQHFQIQGKKQKYTLYYKDEDGSCRKVTQTEYQGLEDDDISDDNYILLPEGVEITEEGKLLQDTTQKDIFFKVKPQLKEIHLKLMK